MERFMETQITTRIQWARITEHGETFDIPLIDYSPVTFPNVELEIIKGYGVRESAPGYLDCTEWEVYATLAEAEARADEIDAEYQDDEA